MSAPKRVVKPRLVSRKSVPKRPKSARSKRGVSFDFVRRTALALPETTERPSYGTAGFRVADKLFARALEDGESVVVMVDLYERDRLIEDAPDVFYLTDHYLKHPMVIVRLANISEAAMRDALVRAWRFAAGKKLLARFDEGDGV